jgi:hypothetical protein
VVGLYEAVDDDEAEQVNSEANADDGDDVVDGL